MSPGVERDHHELDLQRVLAGSLIQTVSYQHDGTMSTWQRVSDLALELDDPDSHGAASRARSPKCKPSSGLNAFHHGDGWSRHAAPTAQLRAWMIAGMRRRSRQKVSSMRMWSYSPFRPTL